VHPYVARKLSQALRRYRGVDLGRALVGIHEADRGLKTSHPNLEALLDRVLLRLAGPARGHREEGRR
jgi:hypothetical protein